MIVECGFLSNNQEALLLTDEKYQLDTEELEIRRLVNIYGYLRATIDVYKRQEH